MPQQDHDPPDLSILTPTALYRWAGAIRNRLLARDEQLKLLICFTALDRWWGWPAQAASALAHARLGTGSGVIEVSPHLSSVASGLSRSFACLAGLKFPALFKQHCDASGVDDDLFRCDGPGLPPLGRAMWS